MAITTNSSTSVNALLVRLDIALCLSISIQVYRGKVFFATPSKISYNHTLPLTPQCYTLFSIISR